MVLKSAKVGRRRSDLPLEHQVRRSVLLYECLSVRCPNAVVRDKIEAVHSRCQVLAEIRDAREDFCRRIHGDRPGKLGQLLLAFRQQMLGLRAQARQTFESRNLSQIFLSLVRTQYLR